MGRSTKYLEKISRKYSVVVPSSGRNSQLLSASLDSILSQTNRAHEIFVVDDSSEQTIDLQGLKSSNVKVLKTGGVKGGGFARNVGILAASESLGLDDFIFFLDDDDQWHPEKVQRQFDSVSTFGPNADVIGCGITRLENSFRFSNRVKDVSTAILFDNCGMSPSTLGIKVSAMSTLGGFNDGLKAWQGRDLFIRMYLSKMLVIKNASVMVFQNQSHQFGRISDQRADRYSAMYSALDSYSDDLPKETRYMRLMVDRVIAKESGQTSTLLVVKYFPAALACGYCALSHWVKVLIADLKA